MILALALALGSPAPEPIEPNLSVVFMPMFGGDSDLGFVMGLFGIMTKPDDMGDFRWQLQAHSSTSLKEVDGERFWPLQRHFLRFEKPDLIPGVKLWVEGRFERILDAGYFGLASGSAEAPPPAPREKFYQYQSTEPHLRGFISGDLTTNKNWKGLAGFDLKYAESVAPDGSQLALDLLDQPRLIGAEPHLTLQPWVGLSFDSRDRRFGTRRGQHHLVTLRGAPGFFDEAIGFVGISALLRHYLPVAKHTVLAYRLWLDGMYGDVPFEELARGGDLRQTRMIGHARSLRGIPWGRVHAPYKAMGSLSLRREIVQFTRPSKPSIKINLNVFAEGGRGWWQFDEGGHAAWAIGGGPRLILAPGVNIRFDWAYSPAAESLSESFYTGFYVDLGEVF
jgi:hypothetical protein